MKMFNHAKTTLASIVLLAGSTSINADDDSLDALQKRILGTWQSISCELRPSIDQANPDGKPAATFLTRRFTYKTPDSFDATIRIYADSACQLEMAAYDFAGDIRWHDKNPAAEGAWSQDYILNQKLELTVQAQPMADQLNSLPPGSCGDAPFKVGEVQDILGKPCVLLKFVEGSDYVTDHDFLYVRADTPNMLFMGGKHVDGTGFYYPENRPTVGLQQPLIKTSSR